MSVGYSLQLALKLKQTVCSTICLGAKNSRCNSASIEPTSTPTTITSTKKTPVTTEIEVTKFIHTIQTIEILKELPCPPSPPPYIQAYQSQVTATDRSSFKSSALHPTFYFLLFLLPFTVFLYSLRRRQRRYEHVPGLTETRSQLAKHASNPVTRLLKSTQTTPTILGETATVQEVLGDSSGYFGVSYEEILAPVWEHNRNLTEQITRAAKLNEELFADNKRYLRLWEEESVRANDLLRSSVSLKRSHEDELTEIAEELTNCEKLADERNEEYAMKCQELKQLKQELQAVKVDSTKKVEELGHILASRDKRLQVLTNQIGIEQSQKDRLKQELSHNSLKFEDEINEKTRTIERLESDISLFEEFDQQQVAELEAVKTQAKHLEKELADVCSSLEKEKNSSASAQGEVAELKKTKIELTNDINALNETVRKLEESDNVLKEQLAVKDRLIHNLNVGTANHRVSINDLSDRIAEYQNRMNDLKAEKDSIAREMKEQATAAKKDKEAMKTELQTMRSRLSEAENALGVQVVELDTLKSENISLTEQVRHSVTAFDEFALLGERTIHTIIVDDGTQHISTSKRGDRKKAATKRAKAEANAFARDVDFAKSRRLSISAGTSYAELAKNLTLKERGFATREELKSAREEARRQDTQMQETVSTAIAHLPQEKTESNSSFSQLSDPNRINFTAHILQKCEATVPHLSLEGFTSTHRAPNPQKESIESRISLWTKPRILSLAAVNAKRAIQREQIVTAACKHMYRVQQHQLQKRHGVKGGSEEPVPEKLCPNHTVSPQIQKIVQSLLGEMDKRLEEDSAEKCTEICMYLGPGINSDEPHVGDASLLTNAANDVNPDAGQGEERDDEADCAAGDQGKKRRKRRGKAGNQQ